MKRILILTLLSLTLAAPAALAQSDLGLKKLGVAVGFVSPENLDGTFSFGVFADHGTLAPRIGLESRIDYWSHSEEAFGVGASARDLTIGARGKYYFPVTNPKLRPHAGAGLGLHFVHAEVTIPPQAGIPAMTVGESSTKLGLDVGGGLSTSLGPRLDLLTEVWYGAVSDLSQLALRVGLSRKLGS